MESDTMVAKAAALIAEVEPEVSWIVAAWSVLTGCRFGRPKSLA